MILLHLPTQYLMLKPVCSCSTAYEQCVCPNITKPNGIYSVPGIEARLSVVRVDHSGNEPVLCRACLLGMLDLSHLGLERHLVYFGATMAATSPTLLTGRLHAHSRGYNHLPIIRPCLASWHHHHDPHPLMGGNLVALRDCLLHSLLKPPFSHP